MDSVDEDWDVDEPCTLVLDCGSVWCKAGFGGEDFPRTIFPALVGRPSMPGMSLDLKETQCGDDVQHKRGMLKVKNPIEYGVVTNWDDIEALWHHCFYNELKVIPEEHPVLLTEAPLNPKANRMRMTQLMFETFNVPSMYIAIQAVLSMYASGMTTGAVIDTGDTVSHCVPCYEGYALPHAIMQIDVGGKDCTDYMMQLIDENAGIGDKIKAGKERALAQECKEKVGYCALSFAKEMQDFEERRCQTNDGHIIKLGSECFRCGEVLFNPGASGKEEKKDTQGIHECVYKSVMTCDVEIRKQLFLNIVVCGGGSMFEGFETRLARELSMKLPSAMKVYVHAPKERKYSVWVGGSILTCLSSFQDTWIRKEEYEHSGPSIIQRKCF